MKKVKSYSSPRGFTLFEILIALIILSVIIGLVLPRFKGSIGGLELVKVVYDVEGLLRRAVVESRVKGIEYRLLIENEHRRYSLQKLVDKKLVSIVSRSLPRNVCVLSSKNPLIFHGDGRMDISNIYIFVSDEPFHKDLQRALDKEFSLGQVQSIIHTEYIYTIAIKKSGQIKIIPPE